MSYQPQSKAAKAIESLIDVAGGYKDDLPPAVRMVLINGKYVLQVIDESPKLQEAINKWLDKLLELLT